MNRYFTMVLMMLLSACGPTIPVSSGATVAAPYEQAGWTCSKTVLGWVQCERGGAFVTQCGHGSSPDLLCTSCNRYDTGARCLTPSGSDAHATRCIQHQSGQQRLQWRSDGACGHNFTATTAL